MLRWFGAADFAQCGIVPRVRLYVAVDRVAVHTADVGRAVVGLIRRKRWSTAERRAALAVLEAEGLVLHDLVDVEWRGPIESDLLELMTSVLPWRVEVQYRVGRYYLDAYLPELKLGVEIDEHEHGGYDMASERRRVKYLETQHGIVSWSYPTAGRRLEPNSDGAATFLAALLRRCVRRLSECRGAPGDRSPSGDASTCS